jgi:hypothetical protein
VTLGQFGEGLWAILRKKRTKGHQLESPPSSSRSQKVSCTFLEEHVLVNQAKQGPLAQFGPDLRPIYPLGAHLRPRYVAEKVKRTFRYLLNRAGTLWTCGSSFSPVHSHGRPARRWTGSRQSRQQADQLQYPERRVRL